MRSKYLNWMIAGLAALIAALGIFVWRTGPSTPTDGVVAPEAPTSVVTLSDEQVAEAQIETGPIEERTVQLTVNRPGEVAAAGENYAEVAPGAAGVVRRLFANVGDQVAAGAPLAALDSAELAAAQAEYANAGDRLDLAQISFEREKRLLEQEVTSQESYLDAKRALQEARIARRTAEQALRALGVDPNERAENNIGVNTLRAPIAGAVIDRRAVIGQLAPGDAPLFVVADLSKIWVNVRLYPDDLGRIEAGADALIMGGGLTKPLTGKVLQSVPNLDEVTRTALVLVEAENPDRALSPGAFVDVALPVRETRLAVVAPETALVRDPVGDWQIFVERERNSFEPVNVTIEGRTGAGVMIAGAPDGAVMVTNGAFFLRAELDKGALADDD